MADRLKVLVHENETNNSDARRARLPLVVDGSMQYRHAGAVGEGSVGRAYRRRLFSVGSVLGLDRSKRGESSDTHEMESTRVHCLTTSAGGLYSLQSVPGTPHASMGHLDSPQILTNGDTIVDSSGTLTTSRRPHTPS